MSVIHKYIIPASLNDEIEVAFPQGSVIRHIDFQEDDLMVWAQHLGQYEGMTVEEKSKMPAPIYEKKTFLVMGTGTSFNPTNYTFLQTVFLKDLVFHIYEKTQP